MRKCVIIGGADINNYDRAKGCIDSESFCIFCDSGLKHLSCLGVEAHLIVGDFDSYKKPETHTETIVLPCEKDEESVLILMVESDKESDTESYLTVDDDNLLAVIFEIFKERNKDRFTFTD